MFVFTAFCSCFPLQTEARFLFPSAAGGVPVPALTRYRVWSLNALLCCQVGGPKGLSSGLIYISLMTTEVDH